MGKWNDYTTKTALKDNDELMILDTDGKANKRTLMDKVWNYVVNKMTTAVIAKLGTTDKTLIGAVNELNSKAITRVSKKVTTNEFGLVGSYDLIPDGSVINIVSVKAYLPSNKIEVHTEPHTYSNYSFFRVINSNGDYLKNTELDFIIFYMK